MSKYIMYEILRQIWWLINGPSSLQMVLTARKNSVLLFTTTLFYNLPEMKWFTMTNFRDQALALYTTIWQMLVCSKKYSQQWGSREPHENFSHALPVSKLVYSKLLLTADTWSCWVWCDKWWFILDEENTWKNVRTSKTSTYQSFSVN